MQDDDIPERCDECGAEHDDFIHVCPDEPEDLYPTCSGCGLTVDPAAEHRCWEDDDPWTLW